MVGARTWGTLGVLLALVGLVVIAPEVLATLGGGSEDPLGTALFTTYGVGVVLAVVATVLVIGPELLSRARN
jgi:hypothetical protein